MIKKTYEIYVDCAACAQKMEDAANKVEGVEQAVVSFMTQKMKVTFADGADPAVVLPEIEKACKKAESECEIKY